MTGTGFKAVVSVLLWVAAGGLGGCSNSGTDPNQSSSAYDRSQKALDDPMHYHPDFQKSDTDISSGSGINRDVDDFINP
jgi:hypothetical protein